MSRLLTAAAYAMHNMPIGTMFNAPVLTDEDAYDVAGYLISQKRPEKANLDQDFPVRLQKPIDAPYGPVGCNTARLHDRLTEVDKSTQVLRRRSQSDSVRVTETGCPYFAGLKKINAIDRPHVRRLAAPKLLLYGVSCKCGVGDDRSLDQAFSVSRTEHNARAKRGEHLSCGCLHDKKQAIENVA